MFLEVAHLGEHQFDLALIALFFEGCYVFLEDVDLSLEFGLDALEGEEVASFPLVLFGVVVGLALHFLCLADSDSGGVD